jgi:hypothetical protein
LNMSRNKRVRATALGISLIVLVLVGGTARDARAQGAIAFQPGITPIPDGVQMGVTPVVSADRRYVRLTVNPFFQSLRGVDTFSFPGGAVSGGGGFGFGGGGAGGIGGGGNLGGGNGNGNGGGFGLAAIPPTVRGNPAIIPHGNRQLKQIAVGGNGGNNGTAVISGLGAVGSSWGAPFYGYPNYGYGYNNYGYGYPAGGWGYGYPGYGYGSGFGYPTIYGQGYYAYNQAGYLTTPYLYTPPLTVNAMGNVMGAIIQSVGPR